MDEETLTSVSSLVLETKKAVDRNSDDRRLVLYHENAVKVRWDSEIFSNFFVRSLPWQRTDIRLVLYNSNQLVQTNNKIYFPFWKESFP